MIGQVLAKDVELDYAELTVKDQFVPRADLYRFLRAVNGSTAHNGRTFDLQVSARCPHGVTQGEIGGVIAWGFSSCAGDWCL